MKRWKTIKQKGEMCYGQPDFAIRLTPAEVERMTADGTDKLTIATHTHKRTEQTDDDPPETFTYTTVSTLHTYTVMVLDRWAANLRHMHAIETPKGRGVVIGRGDLYLLPKFKRGTKIVEQFMIATVRVNSYRDVADAANYFGDRMGSEFYQYYAHILVDTGE